MSGYPYGVGSVGPGGFFQTRAAMTPPPASPLPRLALDLTTLPPILPAPVRDFRTLDFARLLNSETAFIESVGWECTVMPDSPVKDPSSAQRLVADPVIDPSGQSTTQLFGDGIDGVVYLLIAQASLGDGRLLIRRGSLACVAQSLEAPPLRPGEVPFDYQLFLTMFPELSSVSAEQAHAYWTNAGMILRNDNMSLVCDPQQRTEILMLLTAHLAALFGGPQGGGGFGPQITGGINSKSVNGVSLSGGGILPGVNGTQAWYQTTRYGQAAWMKLRAWRLFHYVPGPQRHILSPWTAWPWQVGGAPGWMTGWQATPCPTPRPPSPPLPPFEIFVDGTSITGDGMSAETCLRVTTLEGGDEDALPAWVMQRGALAVRLSNTAPQQLWIDSNSFAGDGRTQETALAVRLVSGGLVDNGDGIAPMSVPLTRPPVIYVDGTSIIGDGLSPETALAVRIVSGAVNGDDNGWFYVYVDSASLVGDGLSPETCLAVGTIEGGVIEGLLHRRPARPQPLRPQPVMIRRAVDGPTRIWIDANSLSGDGYTPATPLAVRRIAGTGNGDARAPVAVPLALPPVIYVDGISLIGDGRSPATPIAVRGVSGVANGNANGSNGSSGGSGATGATGASDDGYRN